MRINFCWVNFPAKCHPGPADLTDNFNNMLYLVLNAASERISTNFHCDLVTISQTVSAL